MTSPDNIFTSSISEIADWQINAKENVGARVSMPALQRGYVWGSWQVEGLWDSLIRQLPIGSFLVSSYQEHLVNDKKRKEHEKNPPDFLLLDGQQRATAVAAAFFNPWNAEEESYPMALWVDLARPNNKFNDRAFMFRLVTQAHPWGYLRHNFGRLGSIARAAALGTFIQSIRSHLGIEENDPLPPEAKYPGLSVAYSWPWDSVTPLPFPLLCTAISEDYWEEALRNSLKSYPFWKTSMPTSHKPTKCWKEKLCELLEKRKGEEYERLCLLAGILPSVLKETKVPVIIVQNEDINEDINMKLWNLRPENQIDVESNDTVGREMPPGTVESLFVRINSAGTPIGGEELLYSTFKSIWPNSQSLVEKIGENAFIRPSRIVALSARLVVSIEEDKKAASKNQAPSGEGMGKMPPALNALRFRFLVHASDGVFKKALKEFMDQKAEKLFVAAREFLAGECGGKNQPILSDPDDHRLGSILMENLARTSPDLYFFFLRWLYDNLDKPVKRLDDRKNIIGALTAIAFFADNLDGFVRRLWAFRFTEWWGKSIICTNETMSMENGKLFMLPLPSPRDLEAWLKECLVSNSSTDSDWKSWRWYDKLTRKYPEDCSSPYVSYCKDLLGNSADDLGESGHAEVAWNSFWSKIWKEHRLVLYAQRYWLDQFFPGYNPAMPDQQEESDRPYDWDHIFPQGYIKGFDGAAGLLKMWREDWPKTIGNLRAWPMELNRGDGKALPASKLADPVVDSFDKRWENIMKNGCEVRKASFINKDWEYWEKCLGGDKDIKGDLAKKSDLGADLLLGISGRLCSLYRHWYEMFEIEKTFGQ